MTASALLMAGSAATAGGGVFDIEALEALGRVSAPCVAPDGKTVLFGVAYENLAENNANNDLYTITIGSESAPTRITDT
ncbi:hypothetical protein, partial [uncultured Muribaculum sp.]|uniref:hypothetical protein n=1 Tax=uncultured Muribaculum sp. TaxID=1918613 RepID=UPI0025B1D1DD